MLEIAGGILLALGILVVGLFLIRYFRVIGMLICAGALVAVIAAMAGG